MGGSRFLDLLSRHPFLLISCRLSRMRKLAATLAVVGALLFSAGSAWADWDDGVAAYKRGDYATALQGLRPLTEYGDI